MCIRDRLRGDIGDDADRFALRQCAVEACIVGDDGSKVDCLTFQLQPAGFDRGEIEQIADQFIHKITGIDDLAHQVSLFVADLRFGFFE